MATRIENSRSPKRVQGSLRWDISSAAFVSNGGKPMRLDLRGFPTTHGADTTAVTYSSQA